jgi:hypothetical protein
MELSEQIFVFLHGPWQLDRSTNGHGTMKGMALFLPLHEDPLTLLYREDGEHISQDGESFSFFREYIYCLNGVYLDVYFAHAKKRSSLLYRLIFSGSSKDCLATGKHSCGQDIYAATYQFFDPNRFTLQCDIHGPRKNLKIQTIFQRHTR